jgi:glutathione S-transferase
MLALPAMQEWVAAAREERDFVPADEPYRTEPDRPDAIIVTG